jgi:hypothetical protein
VIDPLKRKAGIKAEKNISWQNGFYKVTERKNNKKSLIGFSNSAWVSQYLYGKFSL